MNAAEDFSIGFHTMPHDPAIAVWADRRQRVDGAFEAIECVMLSGYDHFERFVIFVLANFACRHTQFGSRERRSVAVFCLDRERDSLAAPAGIIDAGYRFALWKFFWS